MGEAEEGDQQTREIEVETGGHSVNTIVDNASSWSSGKGATSDPPGRGDGGSGGPKKIRSTTLRVAFIHRQDYKTVEGEGLADAVHRKRTGKRILANHDALVDIAIEIAKTAVGAARLTSDHYTDHSRKSPGKDHNHGFDGNDNTGFYRRLRINNIIDSEHGDGENPRWSNFEVTNLRLERMSFSDQVEALRGTDVLVAQYGTGEISKIKCRQRQLLSNT